MPETVLQQSPHPPTYSLSTPSSVRFPVPGVRWCHITIPLRLRAQRLKGSTTSQTALPAKGKCLDEWARDNISHSNHKMNKHSFKSQKESIITNKQNERNIKDRNVISLSCHLLIGFTQIYMYLFLGFSWVDLGYGNFAHLIFYFRNLWGFFFFLFFSWKFIDIF